MTKTTKTKSSVNTETLPVFVQLAALMTPDGLSYGQIHEAMHRSPGAQEHLNDPFTVDDYESQRPGEADPKNWEDIFKICDRWYQKSGLVRNIVDLMSDFCVAGIQVSSPDPGQQAFLRTWFKKVNGKHVSERIANMLYRLGNVGIRRQFATIKTQIKEEWKKASAQIKPEIKIPENITDERVLPMKYVTISPKYIRVLSPEVSAFLDEPCYYLKIKRDPLQSIQNIDRDFDEDVLVNKINAKDVKEAWKTGKAVPLDNDCFKMLHYKKDDFDKRFAYPLIYAANSSLSLYSKMMLADKNVVDSAIKRVVIIKVGDAKTGLIPPMEYLDAMAQQINKAGTGGSSSYIVTQPHVDIVSDNGSLATFLGDAKFKTVLEDIYATFGVPSALTGAARGAAANNFMSMKVLIKKLEYVRDLLVRHWEEELQEVCAAGGYDGPVFITFTYQELGDESAIKKLLQDMYDRETISDETYRYMMGMDHELEELRIANDRKLRKGHKKAPKTGPFHNGANLEGELLKIALQSGAYTLEDTLQDTIKSIQPQLRESKLEILHKQGMKTMDKQAEIDMEAQVEQGKIDVDVAKNSPRPIVSPAGGGGKPTKKSAKKTTKKAAKTTTKKATKKKSGTPGEGRPKNKRDSEPRQKRTYKAPRKK